MNKEVMEDVKHGSTVAEVKLEPVSFAEPGMKINGFDYLEDRKGKSIHDDPVGMESIDEIKIEYVKISVINGYDESDDPCMDVYYKPSKIDPPMPRTSMTQETFVDGKDTRSICTDEIEIEEFKLEPIDESYDSDEYICKVANEKSASKVLEEISEPTSKPSMNPVCNETGVSPCLKQHLDRHDTPLANTPEASLTTAPSYVCDQCDKSFNNQRQFKIHQRCHKLKQCPKCMVKVSYNNLKWHLLRHDALVSCEMCDKSFQFKFYLKRHIALQHTSGTNSTKAPSVECDQCHRLFFNQLQLKSHQRSHKRRQCPKCMASVLYSGFKRHLDRHDAPRVSCEICDKSLTSKFNLKRHIALKHTPDAKLTPGKS